tara:strand:- start:265 stop:714 length:450 start_codon:yes stop_codon:yes gene_type:complete
MQTREILSIVALAALGLCLLCGLAKMAMKNPKAKQSCDHACSLLVFVAVVLVGVSQLLEENKDGYMTVPPNYYYAHKGNEKRRIDQACRDCHGKKSLNELRGDIPIVPKVGGQCNFASDCPGWSPTGGISQPRCKNFKCVKGSQRPSNN